MNTQQKHALALWTHLQMQHIVNDARETAQLNGYSRQDLGAMLACLGQWLVTRGAALGFDQDEKQWRHMMDTAPAEVAVLFSDIPS